MTDRFFVDTNVLVYRRDTAEKPKQKLAMAWLEVLWQQRAGCVSVQVLNEFYSVVTRKLSPALGFATARADVEDLWQWNPVALDTRVFAAAWAVEDRYRLSWWDSLIVAAAQVAGCRYLLSEDLSAGQDYEGVTVVNPFETTPHSLIGSPR